MISNPMRSMCQPTASAKVMSAHQIESKGPRPSNNRKALSWKSCWLGGGADAQPPRARAPVMEPLLSAAESRPECLTREGIVPVQVALTPASDAKVKVRMQKTTVVAIKNYLGEGESSDEED